MENEASRSEASTAPTVIAAATRAGDWSQALWPLFPAAVTNGIPAAMAFRVADSMPAPLSLSTPALRLMTAGVPRLR